ncbi:translocation/assembly module TamB domain-containing protein [Endozoicomonas arenosclerae]|uniref:autotransporter assembly complex protein TamB n=1 Tax=Endozoicomonas arenosclerae TaxID=1633495 RepID=UPI00078293BA|nr:translocation/assembly module TamB domain-containing protein [Endozoicomonas arenosclerae]
MKTALQATLITLVAVLCMVLFLLLTHTGNLWLWNLARSQLPELQGELIKGSIPNGLVFKNPGWADQEMSFTANWLTLQWQPQMLFEGRLVIDDLVLESLTIKLPTSVEEPASSSDRIELPEVVMPLPITLKKLTLDQGIYEQGETKEEVTDLFLSADARQSHIKIHKLHAEHALGKASLEGDITLNGNYPLSAELTVDAAPLNDQLQPETLHVSAHGSLVNYRLKATTAFVSTFLSTPEAQKAPVAQQELRVETTLKAQGSLEHIAIQRLYLSTPQGNAEVTGRFDWTHGIAWSGKVNLETLDTGTFLPDYPGMLDGVLESNFSLEGNAWHLIVSKMDISGTLRDKPVSLSGTLDVNSLFKWEVDRFNAEVGENSLSAHGHLDEQWNIEASINASKLAELYPGLKGELTGSVNITGSKEQPHLNFQLTSPSVHYLDTTIKGLSAKGDIDKKEQIIGQGRINLEALTQGSQTLNDILLEARGNEQQHEARLTTQGKELKSIISVKGSYSHEKWQGQLTRSDLNTRFGDWSLKRPVDITATPASASFSQFCLQSSPSSICIQSSQLSKDAGQLSFTIDQLAPERFKAFFPARFDWQAFLSSEGEVSWKDNQPELTLKLSSTPGTLQAYDLSGDYRQLSVEASIANNQLRSSLNFLSDKLGHSSLSVAVDDLQDQKNLSGQLNIDQLLLEIFAPFMPEVSDLNGTFSAKGRLAGTLTQPLFYGRLAIENGYANTTREIVSVSELNTYLNVNGDSGTVEGKMQVGQGSLNLGGKLDWKDLQNPSGTISLEGQNLDVKYPGIGEIRVSPKLKLALSEQIELTGIINIPWSRIDINSLPESAVSVSDDVVVIRKGQTSELHEEASKRFSMKVRIALGDDIRLDAYGLKTKLAGHLDLLQLPNKPLEGHGTIKLIEGRYRQLGQDLLIKEGKIIFQGPIDTPYLLVNAIRNPDTIEDNVEVGINVSGPVTKPEWTVYSSPEMPQQEQISYLLRGKGLEGGDSSSAQAMLVGIGVSQFGGIATSIGETFGFTDVSLDTEGSGEDTQVTIGGYIAPGLRLQYGAGVFSSVSEVKVRYELMPRLYLQVVSGLAQAVDIFYRFTIKHD